MRLNKRELRYNEYMTISLKHNLNIINPDLLSLCSYINFKTKALNSLYLSLIPYKIDILQTNKKRILGLKVEIQKFFNSDNYIQIEQQTRFKTDFYTQYTQLMSMGLIVEITPLKDYNLLNGLIENLKYSIIQIDKSIKDLWVDFNHQTEYYKPRITDHDLFILKQILNGVVELKFIRVMGYYNPDLIRAYNHHKKITKLLNMDIPVNIPDNIPQNIKSVYYFYMNNYIKTHTSKRVINYINNPIIKTSLKRYCESDIYKDFSEIVKPDLNGFENWFLNKTL
jgi:hypothetical protein